MMQAFLLRVEYPRSSCLCYTYIILYTVTYFLILLLSLMKSQNLNFNFWREKQRVSGWPNGNQLQATNRHNPDHKTKLVGGNLPLWIILVNWDDELPNIWGKKNGIVPTHQLDKVYYLIYTIEMCHVHPIIHYPMLKYHIKILYYIFWLRCPNHQADYFNSMFGALYVIYYSNL